MIDRTALEQLADRLRRGEAAAESEFRARVFPLVRYIVDRAARGKDGILFVGIRQLAEDGFSDPTESEPARWEPIVTQLICERLLKYLRRQPSDDIAATIWSMLSRTATDTEES